MFPSRVHTKFISVENFPIAFSPIGAIFSAVLKVENVLGISKSLISNLKSTVGLNEFVVS